MRIGGEDVGLDLVVDRRAGVEGQGLGGERLHADVLPGDAVAAGLARVGGGAGRQRGAGAGRHRLAGGVGREIVEIGRGDGEVADGAVLVDHLAGDVD
ncbi:hypothetical protein D1614_23850, partial [Maribellus luteus]